jgi:hypothetical protein
MAATPYSNVIDLQPGGPHVSATANRTLLECRDLGARRLREALRDMLEKTTDDFLSRADAAKENDERRFLLGIKDALNEKGSRLEALLATHWGREFDAALKGPASKASDGLLLEELQIVEYGEMDEELALKALARRLEDKCEDELYALGRRFDHLAGRENSPTIDNPASPEVLSRALRGALRDAGFDTKGRLELCRGLENHVVDHIGPIFHAINAHLLQRNILPNIRRDYGRSASHDPNKQGTKNKASGDMFAMLQNLVTGALPGGTTGAPKAQIGAAIAGTGEQYLPSANVWASLETLQHSLPPAMHAQPTSTETPNVLHHFRASEIGQGLDQLHAITVDIVAMLFDMIFDDREIPDPIKALVGKLQIPILKVAMLDKSFFSSKAHPTRRLLDLISKAALRWGQQVGHDDPVYRKIAEIIDNVHANFKQDTALFETLCNDLQTFLSEHENGTANNVNRASLLVVQRELEELADMAVDYELQGWLTSDLPRPVSDLLDHEWRLLLRQIHLQEGPDSSFWKDALTTAQDLIDSVQPKQDSKARQTLARQLPILVRQLSTGFDRIGVNGDRRHVLLDALFSLHAAALRGNEPPPSLYPEAEPRQAISEPSFASQSLDDGEVTVESISVKLPIFSTIGNHDVEKLQRGDWVEYQQADGATRYRLSWISPQRGIFLFTNPQSAHALAISPEAMSVQVQRGEVRILSTEPIFDRALTRTIDILQAA